MSRSRLRSSISFCALVYAREAFVLEVYVAAGLVYEVYGLVGQVAVGYIPLAEQNGLAAHLGRYPHLVAVLVVVADALEYLDGVLDARLGHGDGLEAALERGVPFRCACGTR